ncbi:sensor histidine kinase [Telluribacter sp.]|jgi:hypothetical protein|uniref:sensor histidine kinase n=1 Tax=Telluribacter sp. TaxID=1978767 RepID=UPI002E138832|nr:histidine kinase [Telluribacter sp.]
MKLPAFSRYDWLLQLIVLPIYIIIYNWLLIGNNYWQSWTTFGLATGITLLISISNWYCNSFINIQIRNRYINLQHYTKRAVLGFIIASVSSCLHYSIPFLLYQWNNLPGFVPDPFRLGLALLSAIIAVAILTAIYEGIHNFEYWRHSRRKADQLSKAQLQVQLDSLRQQVNPHFLFNSLNSLISLIDEDPRQAGVFAEELSTVYRYLLRSNENPLVPLTNELEFVQSYYNLLKTRHGDSLTLVTLIPPSAEARQIPPLTLQLLIENAVKHNIILPDQPLTIVLTANEQKLMVSNNLQRKSGQVLSNGVGLNNILSKYQILGQPVPTFEEDGQEFRVTLPLV